MAAPTFSLSTTGSDPKTTTRARLEAAVQAVIDALQDSIDATALAGGIGTGTVYASIAAGLADTTNGDVFLVAASNQLAAYLNDGGSETLLASVPTQTQMDNARQALARRFEAVSDLTGDTDLTYTAGSVYTVSAGDILEAGGYRYEVAASGATDHHVTTAGGVKLYAQQLEDGAFHIQAFGPAADGSTDDTTVVQAALDAGAGGRVVLPAGKVVVVFGLKMPADTTFDFNSGWIKRRPATVADSDDLAAFTGGAYYPAESLRYPGTFYLKGNAYFYGNGGGIDGNFSAETLLPPDTSMNGGSYKGNMDRNGIWGSGVDRAAVKKLHVIGVHFKNMYSEAVNVEEMEEVVIRDCVETDARGVFVQLSGGLDPTPTGICTFTGNRLHGTRQYNRVPNCYLISRFETVDFSGNVVDGRDKLASVVEPPNGPDAGKIQASTHVLMTNNTFFESGVKLAAYVGFVGRSFMVTNNAFIRPDMSNGWGSGVVGGGVLYDHVNVSGNTFLNCTLSGAEFARKSFSCNNNIFTADTSLVASGETVYKFLGIARNSATIPPGAVIRNNTFELGGFAGHIAFYFPQSAGDLIIEGNSVNGADTIFGNRVNSDWSTSSVTLKNNTFNNYSTFGRMRFNEIRFVDITGNNFGPTLLGTPTLVEDYNGRDMKFQAEDEWGSLIFRGNKFDDPDARGGIEINTSQTISSLLVLDNLFLTDRGGFNSFSGTGTATITFACVRNNISKSGFSFPVTWTITRQITDNNIFIDSGDRFFGSQGNTGLTGARDTTVGAAGPADALPANPLGYFVIDADGTTAKVPYYRD